MAKAIEGVGGTAREQVIVRGFKYPNKNGIDELEFFLICDDGDRTLSGFIHVFFSSEARVKTQFRTGHCGIDAGEFADLNLTDHDAFITTCVKEWARREPLFNDGRPVLVLQERKGELSLIPELGAELIELCDRAREMIGLLRDEARSTGAKVFYDSMYKRVGGLIAGLRTRRMNELGAD